MQQYLDLLDHIMKNGVDKDDRTGTGTRSVFGYQMRFDLQKGFPIVTTKKLHLRSIIGELLWFLRGDTNIRYLVDNNINIWNEWPYKAYLKSQGKTVPAVGSSEWSVGLTEFIERIKSDDEFAKLHGNLGPVYGHQWRHWPDGEGGEIDQIKTAIDTIKWNQNSRRIIISAWNVADIDSMAVAGLPPCHCLFQFYVRPAPDGGPSFLDCQLYQRSCDTFLGVPFNIASYALLDMLVAQQTNLRPGEFVWVGGDVHLYKNHFEQAREQLTRTPRALPWMAIAERPSIDAYEIDHFSLVGYDPWPAIKAPIAV